MMWSERSGMGHPLCDMVNSRLFELQAAKEILAKVYDIQISQVDDLIQQRIRERQLFELESSLCHSWAWFYSPKPPSCFYCAFLGKYRYH